MKKEPDELGPFLHELGQKKTNLLILISNTAVALN